MILDMKPHIDSTSFGYISVEGEKYDHDIIITLDGRVKKRKKKLSKAVYGTSHKIAEQEVRHIYEKGTEGLIIGSGQYGVAELSDEAVEYLQKKSCRVILCPTPEAIREWNRSAGKWLGLFHITC
jgi:hypothetical protein